MPTLPPGMFPPPIPPNAGQQLYGQHLPPGHGGGDDGPEAAFSDAFDFSFDTYATPSLAKVLYALVVIAAIVSYALGVLFTFATTLPDYDLGFGLKAKGSPVPGVLALVLGWIPWLIAVLGARVGIEQALATVRTAKDVRRMRLKYVG